MFPYLAEDVVETFGYHPDTRDFTDLLTQPDVVRVLVVNGPLNVEWGTTREYRVCHDQATGLASGIYWFFEIEHPLAVVVHEGAGAASGAIAPATEITESHPLAAALGWSEHHWAGAATVPPPAFDPGSLAIAVPSGQDAFVLTRRYLHSTWTYSVRLDGRTQQLTESRLRHPAPDDDAVAWVHEPPAEVSRFGATLTRGKLDKAFTNTLFSFRATRTTFRPYQFKPVLKLLQTGGTRILVADEVGLGKTIEAGLIWTELEARRKADRVLVVCPSSLVEKWRAEMEMRFGFTLDELDRNGLDEFLLRHKEGRSPKRLAHVISLERLRTWKGLEALENDPPQFDLVIVDEAHAMRNAATRSHRLGEHLSEWGTSRVFLTATPINLGEQDLHNVLELLSPEDYGGASDLALRLQPNAVLHRVSEMLFDQQTGPRDRLSVLDSLRGSPYGAIVATRPEVGLLREVLAEDPLSPSGVAAARRYISDLNTLSTVITRTRKVEVDDQKALRSPHPKGVLWTDIEKRFYAEYLAWCARRADAVDMPVSFAMQMPLRLASACLPMARATVLTAERSVVDQDQQIATDARSWVDPHADLIAAARAIPEDLDSKFDVLLDVVQQFVREGRRSLLFTFSLPTLAYLQRRLAPHARVAVLNGRVPKRDRGRIMAEFRAGQYDIVLANRVASEGLDFEFCSAVINYDLPWNPMEIEQRIGRIDRIGQTEQKILIANFINPDTIDEKILGRVLDRIHIFERSIGPLEPIIQSQLRAIQTAFDFTLTEAEREHRASEILAALETQEAALSEVSDASSELLVSDDVDIAGLEDDLVQTGRYVGQRELALLIDDWARTDGSHGVSFAANGITMELRGNAAMADRVTGLARDGVRSRKEVDDRAASLRAELPIILTLDQEAARTSGSDLLTSTDPLVLAAASVPGSQRARFAHVKVSTTHEGLPTGRYLSVLAIASVVGPHPSQEIWGESVDLAGRGAPSGVVDALLATLARGALEPGSAGADVNTLAAAAARAVDKLTGRQVAEERRLAAHAEVLVQTRKVALEEQLQRHLAALSRRIETSRSRERSERSIQLFERQMERAVERHAETVKQVERALDPGVSLAPLAVCTVEVVEP